MKKGDKIVILLIVIFAIGLFVITNKRNIENKRDQEKYLVITVDGKEYKKSKLDDLKDQEIEIKTKYGKNIIKIENKKVNIIYSDCLDKLCVEMKSIEKSGDSLICLPNRLTVSIESKVNEVDVVLY